jgi:hypothetical protein
MGSVPVTALSQSTDRPSLSLYSLLLLSNIVESEKDYTAPIPLSRPHQTMGFVCVCMCVCLCLFEWEE